MKLGNFYYECDGCNHNLRFEDTTQVLTCPNCGRTVQLSSEYQKFLVAERARIKATLHAQQLA